jgi:hypothetical protein
MNNLNAALTPALSRPTRQGERFHAWRTIDALEIKTRRFFSLAHRMGDGRGEGLSKKSANRDAQTERRSMTRSDGIFHNDYRVSERCRFAMLLRVTDPRSDASRHTHD